MKITPRFFASALAFVLLTGWSGAATPEPPARYSGPRWALLDPRPVVSAAAGITAAQYPNCDYAIVEARQVRAYRADGTAEAQDEDFTKVLTERGRRTRRMVTRRFMMPYTTVQVVKLELIRGDGTVVPVDVAANSRESIDASMMAANIYDPNVRVLQVNVPGLEIGDTIHCVTRETVERAAIPGQFAEENVFEEEGFIRHLTHEIIAPADRPLRHVVVRDEIPGTIRQTVTNGAGTITYRWEVNAVPRGYPEPAMPPPIMSVQRLFVTTLPDWQAVSQWYWKLSAPHLEAGSPEITRTVAQLVAGAGTPTDRIKAIFYYVSKNIRYMGVTPEKDRPGFEPHDVSLTFQRKYGVCRDKAALLVAMLRTAGFPAYPVLESYGWRKDVAAPDPGFNHAIVAVDQGRGEYLLMDPTDENTLELLPAAECNYSYLVCRPEGDQSRIIPVQSPDRNLMTIRTKGELDGGGSLRAVAELGFGGINDNAYRAAFARMKPDDRRRAFETLLKQAVPGARVTSFALQPENLLDRTRPLHAEIGYTAPRVTTTGSGKAIVTLPWLGRQVGVVSFLLHSAGLEQRRFPLQTYVACGVHEEFALKLSPDYTDVVSMPACTPVSDPTKSYEERVALENGVLVGTRDLTIKAPEFRPAEYPALKGMLETMAYDERKSPILTVAGSAAIAVPVAPMAAPPPLESDVRMLATDTSVALQDPHSATVSLHSVTHVLTYNGKKAASEFKLGYNPACEQARIVRARVTSADGQVQEISPEEIHAMDAPWNASAKRYTGGKILVANLPGVEIGSTLEVDARVDVANKPFVAGLIPFQFQDEVASRTFTLTAPAALTVSAGLHHAGGSVAPTATTDRDVRTLRWTARQVPGVRAEPSQPPPWAFLPMVQYFAGDPSAYWRELHTAMTGRAAHATKAGAVARKLAAEAHGGTAAVAAIRDLVAKGVRAAGPSFLELPLSELSDADTTLADGYGHAADRAILLYAMLDAAGFKPELVLASEVPPIDALRKVATTSLPELYAFPLVRVTVAGQAYYLNDTDQYARLGSTTHDGLLAVALPSGALETVHAAADCGRQTATTFTITFAPNGNARIAIARQFYGPVFNERKRFFVELPPEEKRRYFQQVVSAIAQGARPVGGLTTGFDQYPGVETFTVEIDHYAVVDGAHFYFSLPFAPSFIQAGGDTRTLPLYVGRTETHSITAVINLPAGYGRYVILPASNRWEEPAGAGEAEITTTTEPGRCVVNYRFRTAPAIIDAKDYPAVLAIESAIENRSSRLFLVDRGAPAGNDTGASPTSL